MGLFCGQTFFFINNICTLLLVGSQHFLASSVEVIATVEVSHKAVGVRSSSKITKSYVAHSQAFPTSLLSIYTHGTFETTSASLGHLLKSGRGFPRVHRFLAMMSHKSLIAFQKCDGHIYIHTYNTCYQ